MSKFPHAWCPLRQDWLEPEDVRDICAETGAIPELLCPDEACRQERPHTRLLAAGCHPKREYFRPAYFRSYPNHVHGADCPYEILGNHTDYVLKHKEEFRSYCPEANLWFNCKEIDGSLLSDAFVAEYAPREFMRQVREKAEEYRRQGHDATTAICIARCVVPQKTSRLSLVVEMALRLDDMKRGMRKQARLALPGRPDTNYCDAFLMIGSLKQHYTTPYIVCGEATVAETAEGFLINYSWSLKQYLADGSELPACTPIARDQYRGAFLKELEGYAASGEQCFVYSFSAHSLKENTCPKQEVKRCVVIEPITRDAVVIRNRCLKREQKSTR